MFSFVVLHFAFKSLADDGYITIEEAPAGMKHTGSSFTADQHATATYDDAEQPPYESLHMASYQTIVPKGGSLLPDIRVRDLGRYIESIKAKIDAFEEEFKVRHHCSLK